MPVPDTARARQMSLRVSRTLERHAVPGSERVLAVLDAAMPPRIALLEDDHDPRFLHPGRTVLVALEDGGVVDGDALAVAAAMESVSPELRIAGHPRPPAAERAAARAEALGPWDGEDRLERLLGEGLEIQVVAVAEWVDQLRHLRHWAAPGTVTRAGELTRSRYLPLASRVSETLARRLDWWLRRVHLASPEGSVDH